MQGGNERSTFQIIYCAALSLNANTKYENSTTSNKCPYNYCIPNSSLCRASCAVPHLSPVMTEAEMTRMKPSILNVVE